MDVSVSETTNEKTYLKKFAGGASAPLAPPPGSAYEILPVVLLCFRLNVRQTTGERVQRMATTQWIAPRTV